MARSAISTEAPNIVPAKTHRKDRGNGRRPEATNSRAKLTIGAKVNWSRINHSKTLSDILWDSQGKRKTGI
jgi:hypothetical protein